MPEFLIFQTVWNIKPPSVYSIIFLPVVRNFSVRSVHPFSCNIKDILFIVFIECVEFRQRIKSCPRIVNYPFFICIYSEIGIFIRKIIFYRYMLFKVCKFIPVLVYRFFSVSHYHIKCPVPVAAVIKHTVKYDSYSVLM